MEEENVCVSGQSQEKINYCLKGNKNKPFKFNSVKREDVLSALKKSGFSAEILWLA